MTLRPLQDRVLVRRIEPEAKTAGGIFIPDNVRKSRWRAMSSLSDRAPATRTAHRPMDVKPGDRVLFGKWSGTEVKLDGDELMIMNQADIMGVLEHAVAAKKAA